VISTIPIPIHEHARLPGYILWDSAGGYFYVPERKIISARPIRAFKSNILALSSWAAQPQGFRAAMRAAPDSAPRWG
jgi:hypothetical protein